MDPRGRLRPARGGGDELRRREVGDGKYHPRLHHRCRVQIGRHRRGRRHRARQPELERELRALRQRAQHDEHQHRRIQRVAADALARAQDVIERIAARDVSQHQHAGQQRQSAHTRHRKSHTRAAPCIAPVVPVADEQEGKQACQLPEKRNLHHIAREHHAQHCPHEGEEKREKARHRVLAAHVVARIQRHQRANARDQHGEHPRKPVHTHHEIDACRGHPAVLRHQHPARLHLRQQQRHPQRRRARHQRRPACSQIARIRRQQGSHHTARKRQHDEVGQIHCRAPWPQRAARRSSAWTGVEKREEGKGSCERTMLRRHKRQRTRKQS